MTNFTWNRYGKFLGYWCGMKGDGDTCELR